MGAPPSQTLKKARHWVTRRIVGYIIFAIVSSVLGAFAVSEGFLTGTPTFQTACGAFIIAIAFLVSFALTTRMKEASTDRMAREQWESAWRDYYARQVLQVQRAWQEYYARQRVMMQQVPTIQQVPRRLEADPKSR